MSLYYVSEMPKVVGHCDPVSFREHLEGARNGENLTGHEIQRRLVEAAGDPEQPRLYTPFHDLIEIDWHESFDPGQLQEPNPVDSTNMSKAVVQRADHGVVLGTWHPDSVREKFFGLPQVVTLSVGDPTEFLIGRFPIDRKRFFDSDPNANYWSTEATAGDIQDAIDRGDARVHNFDDGDAVQMPEGSIHRTHTGESGSEPYRLFMRLFPRDLRSAGTKIGRLSGRNTPRSVREENLRLMRVRDSGEDLQGRPFAA